MSDFAQYDPVADVLAQPQDERLDYALDLLRHLAPQLGDDEVLFWRQVLDCQPVQARMFIYMLRHMGRVCRYDVLTELFLPGATRANNLSVQLCHLRRALRREGFPDVSIEAVWATGVRLLDPHDTLPRFSPGAFVPVPPVGAKFKRSPRPWTAEDDTMLQVLYRRRVPAAVACLALDRSFRALTERRHYINKQAPGTFALEWI